MSRHLSGASPIDLAIRGPRLQSLPSIDRSSKHDRTKPRPRAGVFVWTNSCLLLALSGHRRAADQCPLSGVKRTSKIHGVTSAYDPERTLAGKVDRGIERAASKWRRRRHAAATCARRIDDAASNARLQKAGLLASLHHRARRQKGANNKHDGGNIHCTEMHHPIELKMPK
jgi:hypothetical protein